MEFSVQDLVIGGGALVGCVTTFWTVIAQCNKQVTDLREQMYKDLVKGEASCQERLTRQSERHERDMKEIRDDFQQLQLHGITANDFKAELAAFGAQVVGNVKAEVKLELMEIMRERDKELISTVKEIISEQISGMSLERRK